VVGIVRPHEKEGIRALHLGEPGILYLNRGGSLPRQGKRRCSVKKGGRTLLTRDRSYVEENWAKVRYKIPLPTEAGTGATTKHLEKRADREGIQNKKKNKKRRECKVTSNRSERHPRVQPQEKGGIIETCQR